MKVVFLAAVTVLTTFSLVWAASLSQEASSYHKQAEEALKRGDIDQAVTYYQKITAINNHDALAHNILGVLYEGKNQLARAESEYLSALSLEPKYLDVHSNLARLYEKTDQKEKAVQHLEKFITLAPSKDRRVEAAKSKIIELTAPGQRKSDLVKNIEKEQADKLAKEVTQQKRLVRKENEKKSQGHFSAGKTYYDQKKYSLALEEFKAALKYDPNNQNAAKYIKLCQGQIDKAKLKNQGDKKKK